MRVGIDSLDIDDGEKKLSNIRFVEKFFTDYEIEYGKKTVNYIQRMCGLFCAKEAFLKALGVGIGVDLALKEVEVNHDNGRPYIVVSDKVAGVMKKCGYDNVDINITHTKTTATCVCILF